MTTRTIRRKPSPKPRAKRRKVAVTLDLRMCSHPESQVNAAIATVLDGFTEQRTYGGSGAYISRFVKGDTVRLPNELTYAYSLDALMPFLVDQHWSIRRISSKVWPYAAEVSGRVAEARTAPLALAIALLRASGVRVES